MHCCMPASWLVCVLAVESWLAAAQGVCTPACTRQVQQRLAQGVTCIRRIRFLRNQRGLSESVACERVATSYHRSCGPCKPDSDRKGPSPINAAWAGPQGRSNGACRTAKGGGTFVVAPLQTDSACRTACASQSTCMAYAFVGLLSHGGKSPASTFSASAARRVSGCS